MDCSHTYFHTARIAFSSDICWNGWLSCCQDNDKDNFLAKWRVPAEEAWREVHWSVRCSEAPRNGFLVARGARDSISALWQKGDGVLKPDRQAVLLCFVSPEFPKLWGLMKKMRSKSMTQHVMFFFPLLEWFYQVRFNVVELPTRHRGPRLRWTLWMWLCQGLKMVGPRLFRARCRHWRSCTV